jgi:hypothetical protein
MFDNKIITTIITVFIIYSAWNWFAEYQKKIVINQPSVAENIAKAMTPGNNNIVNKAVESSLIQNILSNLLVPSQVFLLPEEIQNAKVTLDIPGDNGVTAECGDKVEVSYYVLDQKANQLGSHQRLSFHIGDSTVHKALMLLVQGMRVDGAREIELPGKYLAIENQEIVKMRIVLKKNEARDESSRASLQIFDKAFGKGQMAVCGDKASFDYKIIGLDGEMLYQSTTPRTVKIDNTTPYAVMKLLEYTNIGHDRVALIPPKLIDRSFFPKEARIPNNQMIVVEIIRK